MPRTRPQLAKLTRPRLHGAVARDRLFDQLDQERARSSAICVVGPPGAGKTTLVSSWLDARGVTGIWYQVDPGDTDPSTFFYYLGQAVAPFNGRGDRPLPALTPEYLSDVAGFARRFFRHLFERLPSQGVLVLDNYQEVKPDSLFHQLVADAVAEVPETVTLMVVSRRDPPECYARLIANQNVAFVEWDALKLSSTEAQAIAAGRGRRDPELVRELHALTDGWAAGFILMLERGRAMDMPAQSGPGARQPVFDYFATQILAQVSDAVRMFLVTTAWLPNVSVAAAEALSGNPDAQAILEDLYRRHLFVHRRPGEPPSYLYHALFRTFLQAEAPKLLDAGALAARKMEGARLLEEAGDVESALDLYCESAAWSEAIRLLVSSAPAWLAQGRWKTLQDWVARVPDDAVREPWLAYWVARSRFGLAPAQARDGLLHVLKQFEARADRLGQILCVASIMETHWVESTGHEHLDRWIDRALVLLASKPGFPDGETELRAVSIVMVAMSFRQPRNPMFGWAQERMKVLIESDLVDEAKVLAGSVLVGQSLPGGDLPLGQWTVDRVGPIADRVTISAVTRLMWLLRVACHFARAADYELAVETFHRAEVLSEEEGLRAGEAMLCWWGGHIAVLAGRAHDAEQYAARLERSSTIERPFHMGILLGIRCIAALAQEQVREALECGRRATAIAKTQGVVWPRVWHAIPTIYALLEAEQDDEAMAEIRELREFIAATFVEVVEVELLLAEAYLAFRHGHSHACHALLRDALALAADKGYIFLYRTSFRPHRLLLAEAFRAGLDNAYLRRAVERFRLRSGGVADENWPWSVKIYTLGRFEVRVGGQPLSFSRKTPRRPITLLKALIAFGGGPVAEHKLLDALWPDEDGDAARRALAMALHRLRGLLGVRDALNLEGGAISLDRDLCWVDAFELQRLIAESIDDARQVDEPTLASVMQRVASLSSGPFLPADEDASWAISMREKLSARLTQFVATAGGKLEEAGRWEEAASCYQRGLDIDNLAESFYQGLMRCYLQTGRSTDGLNVFRRMRQLLSITLGVPPSPASEALHQALQSR